MDIKEIKGMSDEELHEWGESADYCGGINRDKYNIECYARKKDLQIINKIFRSFNLCYGETEINLVKRFSKTFNEEIKQSSLFLGRCFDNLRDRNIKRLREYAIINDNDVIWLNNLDSNGKYKFIIECLDSKLRK